MACSPSPRPGGSDESCRPQPRGRAGHAIPGLYLFLDHHADRHRPDLRHCRAWRVGDGPRWPDLVRPRNVFVHLGLYRGLPGARHDGHRCAGAEPGGRRSQFRGGHRDRPVRGALPRHLLRHAEPGAEHGAVRAAGQALHLDGRLGRPAHRAPLHGRRPDGARVVRTCAAGADAGAVDGIGLVGAALLPVG
ncbi:hypothetical protein G6F65_019684 [Rhizopus arrhizus]|nr:hypothetical protein G6F65_019684 [Rhizopus arrhizus]